MFFKQGLQVAFLELRIGIWTHTMSLFQFRVIDIVFENAFKNMISNILRTI